jgi:hypothetical protein
MVLKSKITKKIIKNPTDEELLKKLKIKKEYFPETNEIFYIVLLNNNEIGSAVYRTNKNVVDSTGIDKEYRRKGVNIWLYDHIEKDQGVKLIPSKTLMRDGELFWRNRLKKSNPKNEDLLTDIYVTKSEFDPKKIVYTIRLYNYDYSLGFATYDVTKKIISDVRILDRKFRNKGLATYLYNYIENDQNIILKPSDNLSEDGKVFWSNRLKKNPSLKPKPKNARTLKTIKTKTPR